MSAVGTRQPPALGRLPRVVVDGNNLLYLSAFAAGGEPAPLAIAEGFLTRLRRVLDQLRPGVVEVVWDTGRDPARVALLPTYKDVRKERLDPGKAATPEQMAARAESQVLRRLAHIDQKFLRDRALPALGATQFWGDGPAEGDDLVYWRCSSLRALSGGTSTVIVSSDGDLHQLLTPRRAKDSEGLAAGTRIEPWPIYSLPPGDIFTSNRDAGAGAWLPNRLRDGRWLKDELGWWPDDHLVAKAIMGDSSDGVPGLGGIAEGTVKLLMETYGDADALLARMPEAAGLNWRTAKLGTAEGAEALARNLAILGLRAPSCKILASVPPRLPLNEWDGGAAFLLAELRNCGVTVEARCGGPGEWLRPFRETYSRRAC